ncbi:hypothetical protein SPICUR_02405 [Spiribacter curvatus]|uniref:Uncharacterized protein n=1 Tax=Spiribacter curvatus TaxID=1335757 RepID=U5T242_9GAMM|nr:hypothetical protein [Spiribacter curvatus]AGY91495.1 hypothetical protein SPICUR_02405 [Spiribacter curvatus]
MAMHNTDMNHWIRSILAYASVIWNLRQPPLATATADERARWCRDNCGRFAARWFALGAGLWFVFNTPFVSSAPLGMVGLFALVVGMATIARQILAQGRVGPPPIEPPVEFPRPGDDDER